MKLLIFFGLWLTSPAALAGDCVARVLTLQLPRELKLSPEAVHYLLRSESHRELLEALSRVFAVLNDPDSDLEGIVKPVSDASNGGVAAEDNPFLRSHPHLDTEIVRANLDNLNNSDLKEKLSANELGLLAYLLRQPARNPETREILLGEHALKARWWKEFERMKIILANARYRNAVAGLLTSPRGRAHFQRVWNEIAVIEHLSFINEEGLDVLISSVARGRSRAPTIMKTKLYLSSLAILIAEFGNSIGIDASRAQGRSDIIFRRQGMMEAVAPFFAEEIQLQSSLDDLSDTLDYLFFGTPLPPPQETLYQAAMDSAKALLLPLKNEYAENRKRTTPLDSAATVTFEAFRIKPVDHFKPGASPYVRRDAKREDNLNPPAAEFSISPDRALREFSSFISSPRPLSEILPRRIYQFWFLREHKFVLQQVKFSESVTQFLGNHEAVGRQLVNSLHLGRARINGQAGIKILFGKSNRYEGPVFELKSLGADRGLLIQVDGVWEFVDVVKKDDIDRAVPNVEPM